ncbi:hypothetical protein V5N11_014071 [Cardamine amara subsp. amara]|uniref:Uncharacterized protein n=1 Tax=Cardamine amara subsp. amara TaxID=228776 RepID=A0ABD0ZN82_CARAN
MIPHRNRIIRSGSFWSLKGNTSMGSWMWKRLLKYRQLAKDFFCIEVGNGTKTSFWYANWCSLGRIHELLGDGGFINLGIKSDATVADAIRHHRRRNHRAKILNSIESELDKYRDRGCMVADVAKWRKADATFKPFFSSSETWHRLGAKGRE